MKVPMSFKFRPLSRHDFPLLHKWLAETHVKKWWNDNLDMKGIEEKYGPRVDGAEPSCVFIILKHSEPIGLIQWYRWADYPEHAKQLGALADEAGIDLAIGESKMLGQGLGSTIITDFLNQIVFADPKIKAVVTDPEEKNLRSIRAFEKAGFVSRKLVQLKNENVQRQVVALGRTECIAKVRKPAVAGLRFAKLLFRKWELWKST